MAELGWFTPLLRVRIPDDFFIEWKEFPALVQRDIRPEHKWANTLWAWISSSDAVGVEHVDPSSDRWYMHRLDEQTDPLTTIARDSLLCPGDKLPDCFNHPASDRKVCPWLDFYAYWQVYQLAEILGSARLSWGFYYGRDNQGQVQDKISQEFDTLCEIAQIKIEKIRERWADRASTFDWLSRYRTLVGIWASTIRDRPGEGLTDFETAVQSLLADLDRSVQQLKDSVQEHLLTLWRSWRGNPHRDKPLSKLQLLLQEDVAMAAGLISSVTGEPVDWEDPAWFDESDEPKSWASLHQVLPYESLVARNDFAFLANMYLEGYSRCVSKRKQLTEAKLTRLTRKWWGSSAPFRRIATSFKRLHDHYDGKINEDNLVGLRVEDPISHLNLCALRVEALIAEVLGEVRPADFHATLVEVAKRIARKFGLQSINNFASKLSQLLDERARRHRLPATRDNPFLIEEPTESREEFFLRTLVNFAVMRNYAAHHDCIDEELITRGWANYGAEGIVVVSLTSMMVRE